MHLRHALLTAILLPALALAQEMPDNLQSIRFLSFSTSSHLLLHYNPASGAATPESAEQYRSDLNQLSMLLQQVPSPELQAEGVRFKALISTMEQQDGEHQLYPIWINPVLESQAKLDALAETLGHSSPNSDSPVQALERLALNTQRLLLYYQTRAFGSLAVYVDALKHDAPASLDQAIREDFELLQKHLPEQAKELAKLERNYNFIRGHLVQQTGEFAPGSVTYYLTQIAAASQQIAAQLKQS